MSKVFVGLSGGVDSAVSAALLKKDGYDVTGVFIRIDIEDALPPACRDGRGAGRCPAAKDRLEAMRVAAHLGIPFREVDLSKEYEKKVFNGMLASYKRGETPNPDALCNREIKFGLFYDWCMEKGADHVATGHYAQIKGPTSRDRIPDQDSQRSDLGETHLYAGADLEKDQSYFLWDIPAERLARVLFPIGGLYKPEVRALAKKIGLPNAKRPDSQGLCFLGELSLGEILMQRLKLKEGDVLDEKGAVVGRHKGAALYTLGQRHGFTLFAQSSSTPPHFVIQKNVENNTITVSPSKKTPAARRRIALRETNWLGAVAPGAYTARFRHRQPPTPAVLGALKRSVMFEEPQLIAPGQSVVLYHDGRCLGGGVAAGAQ